MAPLRRCANCEHEADVHGDRAIVPCSASRMQKGGGTWNGYAIQPRIVGCGCPGYREVPLAHD